MAPCSWSNLLDREPTLAVAHQPREGDLDEPPIAPAMYNMCGHDINMEHLPRQLMLLNICGAMV